MNYIEADPLPAVCRDCAEPDCHECDHALERWTLTPESRIELLRLAERAAIRRAQRRARLALTTRDASYYNFPITTKEDTPMKYVCPCGYEYDPAKGDPDSGIAPGTPFEAIPDDWVCPVCGLAKSDFVPA